MTVELDLTELVRVSEETGAMIERVRIWRVIEALPVANTDEIHYRHRVLNAITPVPTVAELVENSRRGRVPYPEAGSTGSTTAEAVFNGAPPGASAT